MIKLILYAILWLPITVMAQPGTPAKTRAAKPVAVKPSAPKTPLDSFSYAIGLNIASNLKEEGIDQLNNSFVIKAFNDVYTGTQPAIDVQVANMIVQQKFAALSEKKANAEKLAGLNFLSENKKRPEVKTTNTGLQYEILKVGTGTIATDTNTIKVHYTAITIGGKRFDSSSSRGAPVTLRLSDAIAGWAEALKMMPVGSKWKLYVPFYLAYRDRGEGRNIPPGATLIFELELLEIVMPAR